MNRLEQEKELLKLQEQIEQREPAPHLVSFVINARTTQEATEGLARHIAQKREIPCYVGLAEDQPEIASHSIKTNLRPNNIHSWDGIFSRDTLHGKEASS